MRRPPQTRPTGQGYSKPARDFETNWDDCPIAEPDYGLPPFMKTLPILGLLACAFVLFLSGCASQGPSPEAQVRELDQQKEAERQQADFRKSLPPVSNPGRGQ